MITNKVESFDELFEAVDWLWEQSDDGENTVLVLVRKLGGSGAFTRYEITVEGDTDGAYELHYMDETTVFAKEELTNFLDSTKGLYYELDNCEEVTTFDDGSFTCSDKGAELSLFDSRAISALDKGLNLTYIPKGLKKRITGTHDYKDIAQAGLTPSLLIAALEVARIALDNKIIRAGVGENMDLSDEALNNLQKSVTSALSKS